MPTLKFKCPYCNQVATLAVRTHGLMEIIPVIEILETHDGTLLDEVAPGGGSIEEDDSGVDMKVDYSCDNCGAVFANLAELKELGALIPVTPQDNE